MARTSCGVISAIGRLPHAGRNSRRISRSTSAPLRSVESFSAMKSSATAPKVLARLRCSASRWLSSSVLGSRPPSTDELAPFPGLLPRLFEAHHGIFAERPKGRILLPRISGAQNKRSRSRIAYPDAKTRYFRVHYCVACAAGSKRLQLTVG